MPPQTETQQETEPTTEAGVPRSEILQVAAHAFRENRDAYMGLGYQYVVLRGDRLVGAGVTPDDAWAMAEKRDVAPEEAFCASVRGGCTVHPF